MLKLLSLLLGFLFFLTACGSAPKKGSSAQYQKGSLTTRYYPDGRYNSIDDIIYDNLGHRSGSGVHYANQLGGSKDFDLPFTNNQYVQKWVDYFTGRGRDHFARYLSRLGRFMPYIHAVLDQYNMPRDIVFLSMIESGFNIRAQSWASAVGPWQFIRSTGAMYGLEVDYYIDERRDVEKSTHAAARHLRDLYQEFGNWYLAFAAYNAGAGKVRGAIERDGMNYWDMVGGRYLRQETKDYVPKILAAALISKNPERYGFRSIHYQAPVAFERVTMNGPTDLETAAECAGVDPDLIRLLNPELLQDMTPPHLKNYQLKVPRGTAGRFQKHYASLKPSERMKTVYYTVAKGDTIAGIARDYGVSASDLAKANSGLVDIDKNNYSKKVKVSYKKKGKLRSKWVKKSYTVASYSVPSGSRLVIPSKRSLAAYSSSRDDQAAYRAQNQFGIQVAQISKDSKKGDKKKKDKKGKVVEPVQTHPEEPVSDLAAAKLPALDDAPESEMVKSAPLKSDLNVAENTEAQEEPQNLRPAPSPTNFEAGQPQNVAAAPTDAELREAVAQLPVKSDMPDVQSDPEAQKNWKEEGAVQTAEAQPRPKPKAPAGKPQLYKVRSGDSLTGIAKKNGITVAQLKEWNGKKVSPVLIAGASIKVGGSRVAAAKSGETKVVKYKVKKGDNLLKIAKAHATTAEDIKKLNGLKSHVIKPGAVLVVSRP